MLQSHQQRVVEEKKELDEKLNKLNIFIHSEAFLMINKMERERLKVQASIMKDYSDILQQRINAF
jgi:hypothetical protein